MRMSRISSISHTAVVVELRGHVKRVIDRVLRQVVLSDGGEVDFRIGARVMVVIRWGRLQRGVFAGCVAWMGAAVISELEASRLVSVRMRMSWLNLIGHSG